MSLHNRFITICLSFLFVFTVQALHSQETPHSKPAKTVRGKMQARPGGPVEEVEVAVHEAPADLPIVDADQVQLQDDDLVLGIARNGVAVAFPVRFLAMYEIVDSRVGDLPVAPTW